MTHKDNRLDSEIVTYLDHFQDNLAERSKNMGLEMSDYKHLLANKLDNDLAEWANAENMRGKSDIDSFKKDFFNEIDVYTAEILKRDVFRGYQEEKEKKIDEKLEETIRSILDE